MVVRDGFVVGGTRGARVLGGATTPLVTSFVGGDILDTGPSTVTAGCGETVSAWFATRCNQRMRNLSGTLSVIVCGYTCELSISGLLNSISVALQLCIDSCELDKVSKVKSHARMEVNFPFCF